VGEPDDDDPDAQVLGTPAYLSPERLAGGPVVAASDVYALGLLLFRALTNELPWPAETMTEMIAAHLYAEPGPLPDLPGIPAAVRDLVVQCLAKEPEDRPSARTVAIVLAEAGMIAPPLGEEQVSLAVRRPEPRARPAAPDWASSDQPHSGRAAAPQPGPAAWARGRARRPGSHRPATKT
jgi:serine/threonine protein kinase